MPSRTHLLTWTLWRANGGAECQWRRGLWWGRQWGLANSSPLPAGPSPPPSGRGQRLSAATGARTGNPPRWSCQNPGVAWRAALACALSQQELTPPGPAPAVAQLLFVWLREEVLTDGETEARSAYVTRPCPVTSGVQSWNLKPGLGLLRPSCPQGPEAGGVGKGPRGNWPPSPVLLGHGLWRTKSWGTGPREVWLCKGHDLKRAGSWGPVPKRV